METMFVPEDLGLSSYFLYTGKEEGYYSEFDPRVEMKMCRRMAK